MRREDWEEVNIGVRLRLLSGFPFASDKFSSEEGFPLIRIRDVVDSSIETYYRGPVLNPYVIRRGDILIGMDGDFNIARWKNVDALLNQRVLKVDLADSSRLDLDFIYYWLQPFIRKVNEITAATTVKHLSVNDILKARGKVPSRKAQEKIARILQSIDQTIEKTQVLIDKYQQIKAGLMHDLFTRGIGPDGQLRPCREQSPELYQETPVGWIPRGWVFASFGSKIDVIDPNPSHRYPDSVDYGCPICSTENFLGADSFSVDTAKTVPESTFLLQNARCQFTPDDVIFARKGKIGLARRYGNDKKVFSHTVVVMKPLGNEVNARWLLWLARSSWLISGIEKTMNTNLGVPTLGVEFIKKIPVPFPSLEEQKAADGALQTITDKLGAVEKELKKLKEKKSGLMHDLLTGAVSVSVEPKEEHAVETV